MNNFGTMANSAEHHNRAPRAKTQQMGLDHGQSFEPTSTADPNSIPRFLPHERVFPIQIGSELFKLSGASISSDGVS